MPCIQKTYIISSIKKKYPSAKEIKRYVKKFTPLQYSRLAANPRFTNAILENLIEADAIADEVLGAPIVLFTKGK